MVNLLKFSPKEAMLLLISIALFITLCWAHEIADDEVKEAKANLEKQADAAAGIHTPAEGAPTRPRQLSHSAARRVASRASSSSSDRGGAATTRTSSSTPSPSPAASLTQARASGRVHRDLARPRTHRVAHAFSLFPRNRGDWR